MNIRNNSRFKDPVAGIRYFEQWVNRLEQANGRTYERLEIMTALGKTHVWGLNTRQPNTETLVIFPGARTSALFWDFDRGLDQLNVSLRIFLVETNGLPNNSHGDTPDIKSLDYGHWAADVLDKLGIEKAFIAGASFGGLICMKLGIVCAQKVNAAFLLNPGCLQPFSMTVKNLYYNLLPIIRPTEKNVLTFLDKAVFSKPNHRLSEAAEKLIVDYEVFALRQYIDHSQKPYYMERQLADVRTDTYLLEGDKDLLFPHLKSIENARKYISGLKEIKIFNNVGHGIETYAPAIQFVGNRIKRLAPTKN